MVRSLGAGGGEATTKETRGDEPPRPKEKGHAANQLGITVGGGGEGCR